MKVIQIVAILTSIIRTGSCQTCNGGGPTASNIRVASFNLHIYGQTKAGKPEVVDIMARIIRRYDIIALQEIKDLAGTAINVLSAAVDSTGVDYEYSIGPRVGLTNSSTEQYVIFYNIATIEILPGAYTFNEGSVCKFSQIVTHIVA